MDLSFSGDKLLKSVQEFRDGVCQAANQAIALADREKELAERAKRETDEEKRKADEDKLKADQATLTAKAFAVAEGSGAIILMVADVSTIAASEGTSTPISQYSVSAAGPFLSDALSRLMK